MAQVVYKDFYCSVGLHRFLLRFLLLRLFYTAFYCSGGFTLNSIAQVV